MRYFEYYGMEMLGIICVMPECNGSIQIKFGWEIEIIFGVMKKNLKLFFSVYEKNMFFDGNKFIFQCDIVRINV